MRILTGSFLTLFSCIGVLSCNSKLESTQSSTSNLSSSTPTAPAIAPTKLSKINLDFSPSFSLSQYGFISIVIVDGAEYAMVLNNNGQIPTPSPILVSLTDFQDNVAEAISVSIVNSDKRVTVASSDCTYGCGVRWSSGWVSKRCRSDFPLWSFPEPGNYEYVATYRNSASRKVDFKIKDPCANIQVAELAKKQVRTPASVEKKKPNIK